MGKTIVINLNTNSISEMPTPAEHYGRGLAMKLVRQYAEDGCSRLDEGNALAIVCGLLTGTNAPCANRASVAAMGNNAVAVSSISGDFPQKLASLGIDALVLTGKYSDGNAVIMVDASGIRIEHMPQLQGKSCNDIVEYIRSTFGNNCAAIGTSRAPICCYLSAHFLLHIPKALRASPARAAASAMLPQAKAYGR